MLCCYYPTSHYGRQMIANVWVLWSYSYSVEDFRQGCCGREKWWWIEEHFKFIRRHVLFHTSRRYSFYCAKTIPQSSAYRLWCARDGLVSKGTFTKTFLWLPFFVCFRETYLCSKKHFIRFKIEIYRLFPFWQKGRILWFKLLPGFNLISLQPGGLLDMLFISVDTG